MWGHKIKALELQNWSQPILKLNFLSTFIVNILFLVSAIMYSVLVYFNNTNWFDLSSLLLWGHLQGSCRSNNLPVHHNIETIYLQIYKYVVNYNCILSLPSRVIALKLQNTRELQRKNICSSFTQFSSWLWNRPAFFWPPHLPLGLPGQYPPPPLPQLWPFLQLLPSLLQDFLLGAPLEISVPFGPWSRTESWRLLFLPINDFN